MKNKTIVVVLAVVAALCLALCACATEPTKYDIRFVNDDGTELATVSVEENGKVAYGGKTPAKASTAEFEYTFAGWTDENGVALTELPAATANATYKARYTSAKRSYAVRFVNGETELQNATLAYGAASSYQGARPEKAATAAESYTFVGWATTADGKAVDIANATVTGEVTYYAVFSGTAVMYDVTWNVGGVETKSQVAYNGAPVYDKATPTKAATDIARYEFAGWAKTEDGKVVTIADEKVVADVTYYAVFTEVRTHFAVKFVSGSTELQNSLVASGAAPVFGGETPEKASDDTYNYTFKGWAKSADSTEVVDLAKESITADGVVYYAVFTATPREFTVTWHVKGTTSTSMVKYNQAPVYGGEAVGNYSDEDYNYKFEGWSLTDGGDVVALDSVTITANTDIYAKFTAQIKQYTLTIKYVVDGSDEAIADKTLLLDKYTVYGKDTVIGETTTITAEKDGYLPDKMWVSGRLTENTTVTVTYKAADKWDGTVATAYESGTGTAEDPYIIRTGAQLAYMQSQYSGKQSQVYASGIYFKLAASIDLTGAEWKPIAHRGDFTSAKWSYFAGIFDGNGYTIKLVVDNTNYAGYGLFEGLRGTVKNLAVAGSLVVKNRVGAIAYMSSNNAVIENCNNYATISGSGYAGGIIGAVNGAGKLTKCVNYGDVCSPSSNGAGGICGAEGTNTGTTYTECVNYGTISTGNGKIGGIIGSSSTATVKDCENFGTIKITDGTTPSKTNVGFAGIVGYATNNTSIQNCRNNGAINGYTNVGGIAGYLGKGSTVTDCANSGTIAAHDNKGAIIGYDAN